MHLNRSQKKRRRTGRLRQGRKLDAVTQAAAAEMVEPDGLGIDVPMGNNFPKWGKTCPSDWG